MKPERIQHKPSRKYTKPKAGQWVTFSRWRNITLSCCDCGLVHTVDFRVKGRLLEARFFRDGPATGGKRSKRKQRSKPNA